jgi:hypothetical protein
MPNTVLWDPTDILCPDSRCDGYRNGKPLFFDSDHLSAHGNELLFPSFLEEIGNVDGTSRDRLAKIELKQEGAGR